FVPHSIAFVVFDLRGTTDIQPHGGVEFQGVSTRSSFRISEHYANFLAQLVNKDNRTFRFADGSCKFSKRLAHQTGVKTHFAITHFALSFTFWRQCRYRVDNYNVDGATSD